MLVCLIHTEQASFPTFFQELVKPGQLKTDFVTIIRDSRRLSGPCLGVDRVFVFTNVFETGLHGSDRMNSCQSVWEDDETNRKVELLVDYSQDDARVTVNEITPIKVTFLDPATNAVVRSIGVWTKTGRAMLANQFRAAGRIENLEQEIASGGLASTCA